MPKRSPWSEFKPIPVPEVKTILLPHLGEVTLRKLNRLEMLQAVDKAEELAGVYVTGERNVNKQPNHLVIGAPPVVIPMSERLCNVAAQLLVMEQPPEGEEPYTLADWAGMAFLDDYQEDWQAVAAFLAEGPAQGNPTPASEDATTSPSSPTSGSGDTQS